jgi:hypothetical protein
MAGYSSELIAHKEDRKQSHVKNVRPQIQKIAKKGGANVKLSKFRQTPVCHCCQVYGPKYSN